jgi:hypothetical protein
LFLQILHFQTSAKVVVLLELMDDNPHHFVGMAWMG